MKHTRDSVLKKGVPKGKGKLARLAADVIAKEPDYANLQHINILFVLRGGKPKPDGEGGIVMAEAQRLPPRTRDIYGFDACVEVSETVYDLLTKRWRRRLMWHELRHLVVGTDTEEQDGLERDNDGRVAVSIEPHDLVIKTFRAEVLKYGIDVQEMDMLKFLAKVYSKVKKKKIAKYRKPDELVDPNWGKDEEDSNA